uniref:Uncharacterized protein n=1 Tax=Anopheles albimanus TaxID=7167 RepID=A0A182FAZ5_ANOAL
MSAPDVGYHRRRVPQQQQMVEEQYDDVFDDESRNRSVDEEEDEQGEEVMEPGHQELEHVPSVNRLGRRGSDRMVSSNSQQQQQQAWQPEQGADGDGYYDAPSQQPQRYDRQLRSHRHQRQLHR